jgi:exonuclease SbcD
LQRIGPAPLAELLEQLAELPVIDLLEDPNRQPWLEVRVRLDEPQPDLRQQIESALQGKAVRLVRISAEYAGRSALDEDQLQFVELSQMTPQDLFSRVWEQAYGNPVDEQTLSDFALLLQDVQLEEEQP